MAPKLRAGVNIACRFNFLRSRVGGFLDSLSIADSNQHR
jgi:hypothetical protein